MQPGFSVMVNHHDALTYHDLPWLTRAAYEIAFAPERNRRAWSLGAPDKPNTGIGLVPFKKKVLWDCLAEEKARAAAAAAAAAGLKFIEYNSLGFTYVSQRGPQHHSSTMWKRLPRQGPSDCQGNACRDDDLKAQTGFYRLC